MSWEKRTDIQPLTSTQIKVRGLRSRMMAPYDSDMGPNTHHEELLKRENDFIEEAYKKLGGAADLTDFKVAEARYSSALAHVITKQHKPVTEDKTHADECVQSIFEEIERNYNLQKATGLS